MSKVNYKLEKLGMTNLNGQRLWKMDFEDNWSVRIWSSSENFVEMEARQEIERSGFEIGERIY